MTMARTINGNLTGRAARTQRLDDMLDAAPRNNWREECADAMAELKQLDPNGWEKWFDANVTDGGWAHITNQVRRRVNDMREFIAEIEAQAADAADLLATQEAARF
jgi:hypothetical protein